MTAGPLPRVSPTSEERLAHLLARSTPVIVAALSGMALVGWVVNRPALAGPGDAPLYPNASIGLIGVALGLLAFEQGRTRLVQIGAAVALTFGGLTFLQYLLGLNFHIDTLLLPPAWAQAGRFPGRMTAASALCLLLSGIALLALSVRRRTDALDITAGVFGVTVATIGGIVLFGYALGLFETVRHGFVAGMSLYGSISCLLVGSSLVAIAWRRDMALSTLPRWAAAAVGVAGVTVTVLFWRALVQHDRDRLAERLRYEAEVARHEVAAQIDALVKDLSRLGRRTGQLAMADWTADVDASLRDLDLYDAIAWIGSNQELRAVVPWTAGAKVDRLRGSLQSSAPDTVRMHGTASDPVSAELVDDNDLLAVRVAACPDRTPCTGELAGFIDLNRLFTRAIGTGHRNLCLTVSTGGRTLYTQEGERCREGETSGRAYLGVGRLSWTLDAIPTPALLAETTSPLPTVLLGLGLVVSALLATSMRLARSSWHLAREVERRQVTSALETATDGIWEWNLEGDAMMRSTMWRGLQYQPEPPSTGAAWTALIHPEDLSPLQNAIRDHLEGRTESLTIEYRIRAADGGWHWMVDRARVVERTALGAPTKLLGIYADITERRAAAEALQASEQRFRTMFDSAFQFQALLDLDCGLLEANRTALDFAGVTLDQVRGKPLWETHWWTGLPEREARLRRACSQAARGETVQYQEEVNGRDGRIAIVEFSVKPVLDPQGKVSQLLAEGRDITEYKRTEDALRAVDALSTIGRLAARVAHEINNPLAGIQSSFLLLKEAVPAEHRYYRYVGAIEREIGRIATVTRGLYGMYRAEQADRPESSVAVVIADAVALLNQLNLARSVRIVTDTSRAPPVLPHPDVLVRQVVFNLIQNAVEASPVNGSVDITVWTENSTCCLSVQDQGPGVPLAMREKIFEDFFSTKTGLRTAGMGLGLSIVRRSLRALRGEIEIQDSPGGGADFRVRLPLH